MALPDEPHTRLETYLARLAGQDVAIPDTPISRIECYLAYLCENGGGVPSANAGAHNATFGGKSLGTSFTAEQSAAIQAGTFDGLFVGDYWPINGRVYRIAGADIFFRMGDQTFNTHHLVVVPDENLYLTSMNDTATTTGGYYGSVLKTNGLSQALDIIINDFGADHILKRWSIFCTAVNNSGVPSAWNWYETSIDIMTEGMVYGRGSWGTQNGNGYNVGEKYGRLPLFNLAPQFIVTPTRGWYWLQDVRDLTNFASESPAGNSSFSAANVNRGVRPFFCLA